MVKKMVRLALACEYQRRPIRRAEISEKVLGTGSGRAFKNVFSAAQHQLRTVFGMEMVELPGREKITLQQKRAAQKSQSQASRAPTSWILTSILPYRFHDPQIISPPAAPTSEEDSKYTSIYTLLISLILLSGGQLPDAKMDRYLRRLGMEDNTPIDGFEKTEKLLKRLEKDGYIVKVRESAGQGEEDVFWVVGPRGKVEVGEKGVQGLVTAVHGELDDEGEDELERRVARSLGLNEPGPKVIGAAQNGEGRKKRGRRRRDEEEEQEDGKEEDEDEE